MLEKLSDEELTLLEAFQYPICQAETLFSDYDNLTVMQDEKLSHVRLGQYPLISHEYILDKPVNCSDKAFFHLRKGAGDVYALGGRLFGKTMFVEKVDFFISVMLLGAEKCGFSSYDQVHIRGVLEEVINCLEHHPIFRLFQPQISRAPNYRIFFKTGYLLESINMNITGKKPGAQFFQKHLTRLYIEEASLETDQVFASRRDAVSENGCVFRVAGMTNFTKFSPCGNIFYNEDIIQRRKVVNLPQYVNPKWDDKKRLEAIRDFAGEQSVGYRIFVKGEVVEDGISVFDMSRIKFDENRDIKNFEVSKNQVNDFHYFIVVQRPENAEEVYIAADIGESAPTEIVIFFKMSNGKYRYEYNITLYNLTDKEQFKVFQWLGSQLSANYIGIDCTDGTGRAVFRSLQEVFPKENLVWVAFNEKLAIDFEKNDKGGVVYKDGKPTYKEEYVSEWSVKHLKDILYGEKIDLPSDNKLYEQINKVVEMQSGTRKTYPCLAKADHLFQAFQVFSITHWNCEFLGKKAINKKQFCKGVVTVD